MNRFIIACSIVLLAGCKLKTPAFLKPGEIADGGIIPAAWAAEKAQTALYHNAGKWITSAAEAGKTWDKWYMVWYSNEEIIDLISVLIKQGYAVRLTTRADKQIEWVYLAWDKKDEFNRMTQEDFDK